MVEAIKAMHWSTNAMKKRIKLTNPEILEQFSSSGQNIIVLAGHTGNWEWLPALISPYGFDLLGVYKRQSSKTFNELSLMIRKKDGVIPVAMKETARALHQPSDNGKPRALLLIADQVPAKPDIQFWGDFLNQQTGWFKGGEKIADKYRMPVFFMNVIKTGNGFYEGTAIPVSLEPWKDKKDDITIKYIKLLEDNIRAQPENWLWSHRRWKHQPEDISLQEWPK
jgi:KDO2-lipid IV(A) lauroyltransferase